jgi:hypothetical protein
MKLARTLPLLACVALSQAGCGGGDGEDSTLGVAATGLSGASPSAAAPVQLIDAEVVSELGPPVESSGPTFSFDSKLVARVAVADLGTPQQVFASYQVHAVDGTVVQDWTTVDATWVSGNDWQLATPILSGQCPHYCNELIFDFAIGYSVNGQTYWDNNGGWNYQVASDVSPVPGDPGAPALLGSQHVMLSDTSWSATDATWRGHIILDNLAYQKTVDLVFSTNGWKTVQTASAQYSQSTSNNLEYWTFAVPMGSTSSDVDFAISYQVAGQTYWDNNLGVNYQVTAPLLVFHETFDNLEALLNPTVGPAGSLTGTPTFVSGFEGSAYYVDLSTSGALSYPGTVIPADRGTIELEARLYAPPTDVPWNDSPFFFLATVGNYSQYTIGLNGNDGYSGGGLVGWAGNGNMATGCYTTTYTYADLLGGADQVQSWHRYAVAWDVNGIPGTTTPMQVYIDGTPVGTSSICGQNHTPTSFPEPSELLIGVIQQNFAGSAVAIDELKVWNYAKSD